MARSRVLLGVSILWLPLSMLSDGLAAVVLPYLALEGARVGSDDGVGAGTLLGVVTGAGLLLGAALQPLAGARNDRSPHPARRQRLMIIGSIVAVLGLASLLVAARALETDSVLVFAAAAAAGALLVFAGLALAQAGLQALLPELVPVGLRGRAAGLKGAADLLGAFLAFAILAVLLGEGQVAVALLVLGGALLGGVGLTAVLVPGQRLPPSASRRREAIDSAAAGRRLGGPFVAVIVARFLFLLGTYAVGRFLLLLVASRIGLDAEGAAEATAGSLAVLALATAALALPAGWLVDHVGRVPMMAVGAVLGAVGTLLLIPAGTLPAIVAAGLVMAAGSASFAAANWAIAADLAPPGATGRALGLANLGTAGAAAAAGVFGVVIDLGERSAPGLGFTLLLVLAATATAASLVPLRVIVARGRPPASGPDAAGGSSPSSRSSAIDRPAATPGGQS